MPKRPKDKTETVSNEANPSHASAISQYMAQIGSKGGKIGGKRRLQTMSAKQRRGCQGCKSSVEQIEKAIKITFRLNRGYGIALSNLSKLEKGLFPHPALRNLRNRTEELRASANHELLETLAGREQRDALRFGRLRAQSAKPSSRDSRDK